MMKRRDAVLRLLFAARVPFGACTAMKTTPLFAQQPCLVSCLNRIDAGTSIKMGRPLQGKRSLHRSPVTCKNTIQFKLTDVGEGIAECEVLKWHVKIGDNIDEFEPVCELQSDKATVEGTKVFYFSI